MRLTASVALAAAATSLTLSACLAEDTGPAPALTGIEWHLVGIEGRRASAPFSFLLNAEGGASGKAPCNRWFATNSAELPALALSPIGATKMACPDLMVEQIYFEALAAMRQAELDRDHLFLTGAEGRVLEFSRDPADTTCHSCAG